MKQEEIDDIVDSISRFIDNGMVPLCMSRDNVELSAAIQNMLRNKLFRPAEYVAAHEDINELSKSVGGDANVTQADIDRILELHNITRELDFEWAKEHTYPATPANLAYTALEHAMAKYLMN